MIGISSNIWERLKTENIQGETLWARRAAPDISERLLAAIDADGKRHLLILMEDNDADFQDLNSRGIGVLTKELSLPNHEEGRYLDIVCYDTSGYDAFDLIGGELAVRLANKKDTVSEIVSRVLSKWRRFWSMLPRPMLSLQEQIGLFAELWFLLYWLIPKVGITEAVNCWRGPYGSRHDFEWKDYSVEVKATTSTRGIIHHINGIDQLDVPEQGKLFLFSLCLRDEKGSINTLPSLVANCRTEVEANSDMAIVFDNSLTKAGYSQNYEKEYMNLHMRVINENLFRVEDDFPRITMKSFPNGKLANIENIEYEINLNSHSHLIVSSKPIDMPDLSRNV